MVWSVRYAAGIGLSGSRICNSFDGVDNFGIKLGKFSSINDCNKHVKYMRRFTCVYNKNKM